MAQTTTARKHPSQKGNGRGLSAILPFALVGAGVLLVVLALWTEYSGEVLLSETLNPVRGGGSTVYTASTVDLEPGDYGLSLHISRVLVQLSVVGGVVYTVTAPEHAGWSERRLAKLRERKGSNREDASASTVISVPAGGRTTLVVTFVADLGEPLGVRLRKVRADFRIALYLGLGLAGIGVFLHRPLFDRLVALTQRG